MNNHSNGTTAAIRRIVQVARTMEIDNDIFCCHACVSRTHIGKKAIVICACGVQGDMSRNALCESGTVPGDQHGCACC